MTKTNVNKIRNIRLKSRQNNNSLNKVKLPKKPTNPKFSNATEKEIQ